MKRENLFMIIIIALLAICMWMFKEKNIANENTEKLQDSITDYYRPRSLAYTNTNTALKYLDSLNETGFIINLTDGSQDEIYWRMNRNK